MVVQGRILALGLFRPYGVCYTYSFDDFRQEEAYKYRQGSVSRLAAPYTCAIASMQKTTIFMIIQSREDIDRVKDDIEMYDVETVKNNWMKKQMMC